MFIFHFIFGVIGAAIMLILLPLRLIGPLFALGTAPLFLVGHFLFRHLLFVILIIVALLIWYAFHTSKPAMQELTPYGAPTTQPDSAQTNPASIVVQSVLKKEDGDSDFATDLYTSMTPPERATYSAHFYWAMTNLPNGQEHDWSRFNIAGRILAIDDFRNNDGIRCRHFSETLKVHTIEQTLTGSACAQSNGGWCKLKPNATPSCNIGGPSPGLFDSITDSVKKLF